MIEKKVRVVITYVGNGVHQDAKKEMWARNHQNENLRNTREYSGEDYEAREDLQYMVEYGAMKKHVVEIEIPAPIPEPPKTPEPTKAEVPATPAQPNPTVKVVTAPTK